MIDNLLAALHFIAIVVGYLLLGFAIWFIVTAFTSFCVVMGMDNVHEWWNVIPTMGFWDAFGIVAWFAIPITIYAGYAAQKD